MNHVKILWVTSPDSLWVHSALMLRPLSCVSSLISPPGVWAKSSRPRLHFHTLTNLLKVLPTTESKRQTTLSNLVTQTTLIRNVQLNCDILRHYLFGYTSLQYLPSSVHCSQILSKVCFVAAFTLHVLTADLQNWLVHKVHSQLLTGQINMETLGNENKKTVNKNGTHIQLKKNKQTVFYLVLL